ncbi:Methyltransferase domain-containing protein [Nonomuraea solani]|uniref:Methyltransferase domain-containing protein n=2 Tax=Nonomuraea solani TaxID=1144553 RepID=A0A1H6CYA8_9ACTN|nr:Methyltransferase domain-containing protein [Nonomuraea solani]
MVAAIAADSPGPDVLDVGCGTGISSRQFQAAGCKVLGIDVDARMADVARRSGVEVEVAAFEAWEPAGRTFDTVIAGQTWHWVDPVAGAAKAAQVLRPGGRLSVFWNVAQPPPEVSATFAEVYARVLPELPISKATMTPLEGYAVMFTNAADGMRAEKAFGEPDQTRYDWERTYTRDEWLDQVPTHGGHSRFAPEQQAELLAGIGAAIDAVGGAFTMEYATVAVTAVRI